MNSIVERFVVYDDLLQDCSVLDPKNYKKMLNNFSLDMFVTSLTRLADLTKISRSELIMELIQFPTNYYVFQLSLVEARHRSENFTYEKQWLPDNVD